MIVISEMSCRGARLAEDKGLALSPLLAFVLWLNLAELISLI